MIVIHITPEYRTQCNRNFWLFLSYYLTMTLKILILIFISHHKTKENYKLNYLHMKYTLLLYLTFFFTLNVCLKHDDKYVNNFEIYSQMFLLYFQGLY